MVAMDEMVSLSWAQDVLPAFMRADFMDVPARLALRGGGIGRIAIPGGKRIVAISDPGLLRHIFGLDETDKSFTDRRGMIYNHLRQRGPHDEPGDVLDGGPFTEVDREMWERIRRASVFGNVPQLTQNLLGYFTGLLEAERQEKKTRIDLLDLLKQAFIYTLSLRLFGKGMQDPGRARLADYAPEYFERMAWQLLFALLPGEKGFGRDRYARIGQALGSVLEEMITTARKDRGKFEGSLLGQLLSEFNASDPTERRIIRGTLGTEVMAGFDSVGVVVAKACRTLAKDTETQRALQNEAIAMPGGGLITYSTVSHRLPLTNDFWKQSLHNHPAFRIIFRNVTRDAVVTIEREGGAFSSYQLKQGDQLLLLIDAAHGQGAHFPFGEGERICPGRTFANTAGPCLTATLLRHGTISLPRLYLPGMALAMTSPLRSNSFNMRWL